MKQIILACTLAAASIFPQRRPRRQVTIATDDARSNYRHSDRPNYRHHMRARHVSRDCFTKTEKISRHGHTIVKETRICR
ncbi:hypothetical protein HFO42_00480 [Rhizobium leguminosarum]|uniref:Uncharacterized protein n=1 Tax=Rhizobium leguminosarum TaxID=384 RepID=A0AAJ1A3I1_RHILE|nr:MULTISPECIES: hypothetical protein [Rhizobium]MBY3131640.1 hypothetical protein [Rhizobium laguerreae]MBY5532404.1 hypothetical protein [Rhizobium leguminosarum]MBY5594465.1 hypothetical protein [Rhizobium leguminosarum]MBY5615353.1 hypothetical protein [Rhizobium leguminosarum]MBY5626616.1 hypothetical protein [Rhizobium leguminosarum]